MLVQVVGDTRPKVISFQWSVFSFVQVHPGGSVATEGSGGGEQPIHLPTGCFVTRKLVPPAWIYDQVHPGGSAATEGSGGWE
ncbi:MAG: hypothetical protein FWF18_02190 [Dehalococcoidia bacterium]|nr:hypothetical protein [Dehalococcoidia bacterium]